MKKKRNEIKLDLMDWKSIEEETEKLIRETLTLLAMHRVVRFEAKRNIKKFGGKTSEEMKEEEEIKRENENKAIV